jgi:hypothetical protein
MADAGAPDQGESTITAQIGMHIDLELQYQSGEQERLAFDLVADANADYYAGFLSVESTLGRTILGHVVGSQLAYPQEDVKALRILAISPAERQPPKGRGKQRDQFIRQAVAESEFKNRLAVATSMSNKWGDLDADGFLLSQPKLEDPEDK